MFGLKRYGNGLEGCVSRGDCGIGVGVFGLFGCSLSKTTPMWDHHVLGASSDALIHDRIVFPLYSSVQSKISIDIFVVK